MGERSDRTCRSCRRGGIDFTFELAGDREIRPPLKKILGVVDFAGRSFRWLRGIDRRHAEHLARTLAVAGCDNRRVEVEKAFLLKKIVNRPRDSIPHTGDRSKRVGPRPQMGPLAELLK